MKVVLIDEAIGEVLKPDTKHVSRVTFDEDFTHPVDNYDEAVQLAMEALWPGCTEPGDVFPPHHYIIESQGKQTVIVWWTNDDEERDITPKYVYSYNCEGCEGTPVRQLSATWQAYSIGDICTFEAGAPGVGHVSYKVTRKDEEGLFGICIENTIWVPDGAFFE